MSEVIATVSVRSPRAGIGVEVCFEFPGTGQTVHLPLPDRGLLAEVRRKAGIYLERVVPLTARLNAGTEQAASALRILLNKGRELTALLVQDDIERFLRLESAFRAAWPRWRSADWSDDTAPLPMVELHCHDDTLPLELLPLFDFGPLPELRTYADLAAAASRFLGFATVVRRVVPTPVPADRVLRNDPALPVQFLRHRGLPSAQEEERFLASLGGHVRVDGPWPVAQDEGEVRDALLRALYDGSPLDGSAGTAPPVQVQHFACHCDTTAELDDDYVLALSTRNGKARRLTFGELREGYYERIFADGDSGGHRAVIILNACASSRTNPLTAYSFPRWFLNRGHRAFIGTETDVPDGVAAGFAAAFYGRLLEARRPLGEAVVWARRDLLRDFRNPLGLLYVMYGDTQLTVERARPGVYRASAGRAA
ncbi:hypothetical protein CS0771_61810 [Catellatospora sp. IY07-71]|uniref:CHAT domain-containing protein n=1 Tax=Catellatospora sp. IY07-71 TaxID=2728827 RepID=UPI001BB31419|nr:CHAT domain-containing protein [Catellatospora sp. IY07-71]BCJ76637.1 hypothetical protein CS0771_61810 [Catellatospora sp. IY07-71]